MLKNVMFTLLVGTLLTVGPEVTCKKSPAIFSRRVLVREYPVNKTKISSPTTKQASPKKDELPVLKLLVRAPLPSRRQTSDEYYRHDKEMYEQFQTPKVFEFDKGIAQAILEKLLRVNKNIVSKLKKLKKPSDEAVKEAEWANQNIAKLSGIKDKFLNWNFTDIEKFYLDVEYWNYTDWFPWRDQGVPPASVNLDVPEFESLLIEFPQIFEHEVNKTKLMVTRSSYVGEKYEECPKSCPTEAHMVCAKCKDGIYRTFVSVCHLRMFNCKHPEEKVRLVARRPCIMSAPYDKSFENIVAPKKAPLDDDPVERHVWCQKYGKRSDPRCKDLEPVVVKLNLGVKPPYYPLPNWPGMRPGYWPPLGPLH